MPRLLTDQEAVFLERAMPGLDPGRASWARGELVRWQKDYDRRRAEEFVTLESRFLDPREDFYGKLPEADRQMAEWSDRMIGAAGFKREDNKAFMRAFGWDPSGYELGLAQLGAGVLGIEGPINDDSFYDAAKKKLSRGRERRELAAGLAERGQTAAYMMTPPDEDLARWYKANPGLYDWGEMAHFLAVYGQARKEANAAVEPYRDAIEKAINGLRSGPPTEDGAPGRPDINAVAAELGRTLYLGENGEVPPMVRAHVLAAISAGAAALDAQAAEAVKPDSALQGYSLNIYETFQRMLEGMGQSAEATASSLFSKGADSLLKLLGNEDPTFGLRREVGADATVARLAADLRRIRDAAADPIKGIYSGFAGAVERGVYGAPGAVTFSALATNPVGIGYAVNSIAAENSSEVRSLDPEMPPWKASAIGGVSAAAELIVDRLQAMAIAKYIPGTTRFLRKFVRDGNKFSLNAKYTGALWAYETALETGQGLILPVVRDAAAALSEDIPDVDWDAELSAAFSAETLAETAVAMFPLVAAGGSRMALTRTQARALAPAIDGTDYLERMGFSTADAAAVRAEADPVAKWELLRSLKPNSPPAAAAPDGVSAQPPGPGAVAEPVSSDPAIRRDLTSGAWTVETPAGAVTVPTYDEALAVREMAADHQEVVYGEKVAELAKAYDSTATEGQREIAFNEQQVRLESDVASGAVSEEQAYERAKVVAETAGFKLDADPLATVILGTNSGELKGKVYDSQIRLNQGATVATVVNEKAQDDVARMMATGILPKDQAVALLREWEKRSGDSVLKSETDLGVKEAWGQMGVAMSVVRSKGNEPVGGFRSALARVAFAYRTFFRAVMGRAAKLRKAIREGTAPEGFIELLDQSIGFDDIAAVREGRAEARKALPSMPEGFRYPPDGEAFSMAPAEYISRVGDAAEAFAVPPDSRVKRWEKAAKIIRDIEAEFLPIAERLAVTRKSIRERRRAVYQEAHNALIEQNAHKLMPLEVDESLATVIGHPLAEFLLTKVGKLRSRAEQRRRDRESGTNNMGEYDGMPRGIPPKMMGGGVTPDTAAQEAYNHGLIEDPYPGTLWDKLGEEIADARAVREGQREARAVLREIEAGAREAARWWEEQQVAEVEATRPADLRAATVKSLAMLDEAAAAMPKEIRHAAGKFSPLAKLASNEARVNEIVRRAVRLAKALEVYLQVHYLGKIEALLESAAPTKNAKGIKKGRFGAEGEALVAAARAATLMDADEYAAEKDRLAAKLADAREDVKAADIFEESMVLDAFANIKERSAAEAKHAYELLKAKLGEHGKAFGALQAAKKKRNEDAKASLLASAGAADIEDAAGGTVRSETLRAKAAGVAHSLLDIGQWMEAVFPGNEYAQGLVRRLRANQTAHERAMIAHKRKVLAWVKNRTGAKSDFDAENWIIESLRLSRGITGAERFVGKPDMLRVPVAHAAEIARDPGGKHAADLGLSAEKAKAISDAYTKAMAGWKARADAAEALGKRKPAKPKNITADLSGLREKKPFTPRTKGEALHELLFLEQPGYQENQERRGYPLNTADKLRAFVGDDVYAFGVFMRGELEAIFPRANSVFRRMNGVSLANLSAYWPGNIEGFDSDTDTPMADMFTPKAQLNSRYPNSMIERVAHTRPTRIMDAMDAYFAHLAEMEYFIHTAELSEEMHAVFESQDVRNSVKSLGGSGVAKQMHNWVRIVDAGGDFERRVKGWHNKIADMAYDNFVVTALGAKLSTLMVQFTNRWQAVAGLRAGEFRAAQWRLRTSRAARARAAEAVAASGYIGHRKDVGVMPEIRALTSQAPRKVSRAKQLGQRSTEIHSLADAHFLNYTGAVAYEAMRDRYTKQFGAEKGKAMADAEIGPFLESVAQPMNHLNRSQPEIMADGLTRLVVTTFISDARRKLSFMIASHLAGSHKETARLLLNFHIRFGVSEWAIRGLWFWLFRGEEPEEAWSPQRLLVSVVFGPWVGVPWFGKGVKGAYELAKDGFMFDSDPVKRMSKAAVEPVKNVVDMFQAISEGEVAEAFHEGADALQAFGAAYGPAGAAGNVAEQMTGLMERVFGSAEED